MFKKAKPTFLSRAGRQGAPSVIQPFAQKNTKASAAKHAAGNGKNSVKAKKKVVKNGAPLKTGKMKGTINSFRTGKSFSKKKALTIDQRLSKYFMSVGPKLSSATHSPQSAPQAYKPRS